MTITDLFTETRLLVDATSTSYADADLLRRMVAAQEEIAGKLIQQDGTWQFDDSNYTSHPIGTANLVAGQQDYAFDVTMLDIERVEVQDNNGIWKLLNPVDKSLIKLALPEYLKTNGLPLQYDKNGSSLFLYPAPAAANVTLTNGLKVYFQRTAKIFTSSDIGTSAVPGFASPYHILLAYKAALPYAMQNKPQRVPALIDEINRLTADMIGFYSRRTKDERRRLTVSTTPADNSRGGALSGQLYTYGVDSNQ